MGEEEQAVDEFLKLVETKRQVDKYHAIYVVSIVVIEKRQLIWYGYVSKMEEDKWQKKTVYGYSQKEEV